MSWAEVEAAVSQAKSIAFDGCHKIYILLDDTQTQVMIDCAYRANDVKGDGSRLYTREEMTPEQMLSKLHEWFDISCGLKFISAVKTVDGDPNDGFTSLISQFEFETEEEDE